jgi:hypothetical protein
MYICPLSTMSCYIFLWLRSTVWCWRCPWTSCRPSNNAYHINIRETIDKCLGDNSPTLLKIMWLCVDYPMISLNIRPYEKWMRQNWSEWLTRVVESTGTPQDITRRLAFLQIWKIISSTTSTQGRQTGQCKGIRLRSSLCHRNNWEITRRGK